MECTRPSDHNQKGRSIIYLLMATGVTQRGHTKQTDTTIYLSPTTFLSRCFRWKSIVLLAICLSSDWGKVAGTLRPPSVGGRWVYEDMINRWKGHRATEFRLQPFCANMISSIALASPLCRQSLWLLAEQLSSGTLTQRLGQGWG